jgi:deoxyribodipyrimidine photo-lyase
VVARLAGEAGVDAVFLNRDYTPFARARDAAVERAAREHGVAFESFGDALLHEPGEVMTGAGTPYSRFTPFHRRAAAMPIRPPRPLAGLALHGLPVAAARDAALDDELLPVRNERLHVRGGRAAALARLAAASRLDAYAAERDLPAVEGTSSLSADLKFGTLSVREVHRALAAGSGDGTELLRQRHWRDFFTHLAWFEPRVFAEPFDRRMAGLRWDDDEERFAAWRDGRTGFPLVDAGMRQLAATGWMHNRARLVTASFLVKDLGVDWRRGEAVFREHLLDADTQQNTGNWQWVAGVGTDAAPYFRVFNPTLQARKFDPHGSYIRRWVPELEGVPDEHIHEPWRAPLPPAAYPAPIVDHAEARQRTLARYRAAQGS